MKPLLDETDDALEQALLREARDYKASPKTRERALAIVGLGKTSWMRGAGLKIALGVVAAGAIFGGWWRMRAPSTDTIPSEPGPTLTAETTVTAQATIAATAPAALATSAAPMPVLKTVAPAQSVRSTLSEEIGVIDRARDAVYSKNREGAIRALDEYDRRFPKGSLAPEAKTLRARAEALP